MKKSLTPLMLASIIWLFLASTAGAQKLPEGTTVLPQNLFEASSATTTEAVVTEQVPAAVSNSYGQSIIDRYKAMGRPLPAPESEILKLKPGKVPANAPLKAGEKPVEFIGFLNYNAVNGRMLLNYGLYKFSTASGLKRQTYADVAYVINFGGAYIGNRLTGLGNVKINSNVLTPYLCSWDTDTWRQLEEVRFVEDGLYMHGGACTDPVTQTVYGYARNYTDGGYDLCKVDYANRTSEVVAHTDSTIAAFAIDANGVGYAMTGNDYLLKVDLATGEMTTVGYSGYEGSNVLQSMAFDYETGKLYYAISQVDWDTYDVIGTLQDIDTTTGKATLVGYFPENEEYTCLHVLHTPNNGAPADITDLTVTFENGSLNGKATFTIPTTTEDGGTLSGNVNYTIYLQDDEANPITGTATAGASVTQTLTATESGWYKVVVVLDNAAGKGRRIAKEVWVGEDSPKVTNATFKYDESTHQATVEWTLGGANGGYGNPEGITYEIVRNPGAVKVGTNVTTTSFTETFEPGYYDGYYYVITPYQSETPYEKGMTNMIQMGKAYETPYADALDSVDVINRYLVIDANNDDVTWEQYQNNYINTFCYSYNIEESANDWILTPPMNLKKDCEYEFSFGLAIGMAGYEEKFAVVYGQGTDPNAYTVLADDLSTELTFSEAYSRGFDPKSTKVVVNVDGEYRFGFHITSDAFQGGLFLANLAVSDGQLTTAPDSVTNLNATAAPEGELTTTFTFTAPTVNCKGEKLDELTQIVVYREDGDVACTLDNPKPGQSYTITDADALNGWCTYTIVAYNKQGKGRPAAVRLYVGLDAPVAPIVTLRDNCDGTANLSWSVPVIGENGGYVDVDGLEYDIYGYDEETGIYKVADGVKNRTYTVTDVPTTGEQKQIYYAVQAVSDFGMSDKATSNYIIGGAPYVPYYFEGFDAASTNGLWIYNVSDNKKATVGILKNTSHDLTNTSVVLLTAASDQWVNLTSGKISVADAQNPHLVFFYYNQPGTNQRLDVIVHSNGFATSDTVTTIDFNQATGTRGFKKVDIDLNSYKSAAYVDIEWLGTLNGSTSEYGYVLFDDINVVDLQSRNLAVSASAPSKVALFDVLPITVQLHNIGSEAASDYSTGVVINGNDHTTGSLASIESFEWLEYVCNYPTSVNDSVHTQLWAVADLDGDADLSNNISDTLSVTIVQPILPAPENLAATETSGQHHLTWEAPDVEAPVTDSFETYAAFSVDAFGDWRGATTHGSFRQVGSYSFPITETEVGFMTCDFTEMGYDLEQNPSLAGKSGSEFATCLPPSSYGKTDSWLISPELSGKAQTITFWINAMGGYMADTYEVAYSTEGNAVADFTTVAASGSAPYSYSGGTEWQEVTVELPEGAKYFAIHINTAMVGGMVMIDDVTYAGVPQTVKAYNIYRNGELVATVDASELSCDVAAADGVSTYVVTAVYESGQSGPSNRAVIDNSGVEELIIDSNRQVAGIDYYTVDGRQNSGLQSGVNIVRTRYTDGTTQTHKIVVK